MGPGLAELTAKAARVRALVFDVDGVLTDGGLYYGPSGEAQKRFDVRDGHGFVLARLTGLPTAILSGRRSEAVEVRARELGVVTVVQGSRDKAAGLQVVANALGVPPSACAYMGDDVNDLVVFDRVGLSSCPGDAVAVVRERVDLVTRATGGHGAARELIEFILRASDLWETAMRLMTTEQAP